MKPETAFKISTIFAALVAILLELLGIFDEIGGLWGVLLGIGLEVPGLLFFLLMTKRTKMYGIKAKLFSSLWFFLACLVPITSEASIAAVMICLVQILGSVWVRIKLARCPACGKILPVMGDWDHCNTCNAKL